MFEYVKEKMKQAGLGQYAGYISHNATGDPLFPKTLCRRVPGRQS